MSSAKSKITSKGQVTIPKQVREALGMEEGDFLIFETMSEYEASVRVLKSKPLTALKGALKSSQSTKEWSEIREQARDSLAKQKTNKKGDDQ